MRAFIAACIAIGILWAVDVQFNDGRYSNIVQRALKSMLATR
jgi:rhamnogalacturonyl hydrolase YesR